jgi:catechol 2,3-dioxygenase-like lactoylglutathione lyase family enzyme
MATTWVDVRTPRRAGPPLALVQGFGDLAIEVSDPARARGFYVDLLGFTPAGETDEGPRLRINADQALVLAPRAAPTTLPETGRHQAFRLPAARLPAVLARLEAAGVAVHDYHEDRAAERAENRYCADPDGNRLQLVAGAATDEEAAIDHVAVETHDLEWAEAFYTHVLGGQVETRIGWHMEDYGRAAAWGAGRDACAPGTRRWDRRYTTMEDRARVARPNAHIFVALGPDVVLGVYLATEHRQEPPRAQFRGTPRIGLRVRPDGLEEVARRLREMRLRPMPVAAATGAPYEREGTAVFAKDPGGNFLAFMV